MSLTLGALKSVEKVQVDLRELRATEVPMALADQHQVMATGDRCDLVLGDVDLDPELLRRAIDGAGFGLRSLSASTATVERLWSLPDYVGADMKLLVCGLNPSPSSADSGVGYYRAGNRFWPAAIAAGLVSVDRDPRHALREHGMGMTDLVKRATRRADELDKAEYQEGLERVASLVDWLQPRAICMVGLAGWRATTDRKAQRGWQSDGLGGRPVYLMPSTSGLNAHDTVDSLAEHLHTAQVGAH